MSEGLMLLLDQIALHFYIDVYIKIITFFEIIFLLFISNWLILEMFDTMVNKNLFWSLSSSRLPPNIREYKCQFVIDQCKLNNEIIQKTYLRFVHPQKQSTFQITIDELNTPSSCIYQAQINIKHFQSPKTALGSQFDSICFTTVHNYQKPPLVMKEIKLNDDSPYHSEEQLCPFFELENDVGQYYSEDEESLVDYSNDNEKFVKHEVLMYLKNQANRLKKMKDIKAHLKKLKYNVPDNHLKTIIASYCGTHIMDRKKGFVVHDDYLSLEERQSRVQYEEELERKQREKEAKKKQKKKGTKKESKAAEKPGKKKIQITSEQVVKYAQSQNSQKSLGLLMKQTNNRR